MNVGILADVKERFDFFWVFVPRRDSWRLCRLSGEARIPVFHENGMWIIFPEKVENWPAIGIDMPKHPMSRAVPKTSSGPVMDPEPNQ